MSRCIVRERSGGWEEGPLRVIVVGFDLLKSNVSVVMSIEFN
jgi:hypothetical protein